MDGYDTAQICLNGHVITSTLRLMPQQGQDFCGKCGAPTIKACKSCNTEIRGHHLDPASLDEKYSVPSYCHGCGQPYPWTEAALKAAQELADELDDLTEEEKRILKESLGDITRDTRRTTVAATRFKELVARMGPAAAEGFRDVLVDVISETAKKLIWP